MKNLTTIFLLFFSITFYSQNKEKQIVYVLFDSQSKEKCKVPVEGEGYQNLNKFRKEVQGEYTYFKICDETFSTHKTKSFKDTCSINYLEKIKLTDFDYLVRKHNSNNELKHRVFDKIFFFEQVSKEKFIKYEVTWIDEILMIDD